MLPDTDVAECQAISAVEVNRWGRTILAELTFEVPERKVWSCLMGPWDRTDWWEALTSAQAGWVSFESGLFGAEDSCQVLAGKVGGDLRLVVTRAETDETICVDLSEAITKRAARRATNIYLGRYERLKLVPRSAKLRVVTVGRAGPREWSAPPDPPPDKSPEVLFVQSFLVELIRRTVVSRVTFRGDGGEITCLVPDWAGAWELALRSIADGVPYQSPDRSWDKWVQTLDWRHGTDGLCNVVEPGWNGAIGLVVVERDVDGARWVLVLSDDQARRIADAVWSEP